jgi:cytochrome bd-type quinol oxidase subunit 1
MHVADMVDLAAQAGGEVIPARAQMATTLGFHIILACLGIALPTIVLIAEFNAWMNQPGGFTMRGGRIVSVDPWQVYFNHAAAYEMPHMILAAYMVTGFIFAGVYVASILRGRRDRYHYTGLPSPSSWPRRSPRSRSSSATPRPA